MKTKINWIILLSASFLILIVNNWKNLKYFPNLVKELRKIFKGGLNYAEDGDFILIPRPKTKEF